MLSAQLLPIKFSSINVISNGCTTPCHNEQDKNRLVDVTTLQPSGPLPVPPAPPAVLPAMLFRLVFSARGTGLIKTLDKCILCAKPVSSMEGFDLHINFLADTEKVCPSIEMKGMFMLENELHSALRSLVLVRSCRIGGTSVRVWS